MLGTLCCVPLGHVLANGTYFVLVEKTLNRIQSNGFVVDYASHGLGEFVLLGILCELNCYVLSVLTTPQYARTLGALFSILAGGIGFCLAVPYELDPTIFLPAFASGAVGGMTVCFPTVLFPINKRKDTHKGTGNLIGAMVYGQTSCAVYVWLCTLLQ